MMRVNSHANASRRSRAMTRGSPEHVIPHVVQAPQTVWCEAPMDLERSSGLRVHKKKGAGARRAHTLILGGVSHPRAGKGGIGPTSHRRARPLRGGVGPGRAGRPGCSSASARCAWKSVRRSPCQLNGRIGFEAVAATRVRQPANALPAWMSCEDHGPVVACRRGALRRGRAR
jgi:hypothetical protein